MINKKTITPQKKLIMARSKKRLKMRRDRFEKREERRREEFMRSESKRINTIHEPSSDINESFARLERRKRSQRKSFYKTALVFLVLIGIIVVLYYIVN